MSSPSVAIVGAGPAGCYAAQALRRARPDLEIGVIDRLPFPYGLVRYGVAADHQGTKAVTAQFDRMFSRDRVEFIGGIEVGNEIPLEILLEDVDLVVWAGGLHTDQRLGIPGESLPGVYGAGELSRAWNAHPMQPWEHIRIAPEVVIVGAGNVAVDIARLLSKDAPDLDGSDLDDVFTQSVPKAVTTITLVSRSAPGAARWDTSMVRELVSVPGLAIELDAAAASALAAAGAVGHEASALILEAHGRKIDSPRLRLRMAFSAKPTSIAGDDHVTGVVLDDNGTPRLVHCGAVVTAIGFAGERVVDHERIVRAGWARTGPRGTIPEQRSSAKTLVAEIADRLPSVTDRPGLAAVRARVSATYSFDDWMSVDGTERASAPPNRMRRKIRDTRELKSILSATRTRGNG